eukprot:4087012-Pleurochrysis_carterae.AAC.1
MQQRATLSHICSRGPLSHTYAAEVHSLTHAVEGHATICDERVGTQCAAHTVLRTKGRVCVRQACARGRYKGRAGSQGREKAAGASKWDCGTPLKPLPWLEARGSVVACRWPAAPSSRAARLRPRAPKPSRKNADKSFLCVTPAAGPACSAAAKDWELWTYEISPRQLVKYAHEPASSQQRKSSDVEAGQCFRHGRTAR